jgi:two-component system nitrogen regulation sensor histidine kinase NtrY
MKINLDLKLGLLIFVMMAAAAAAALALQAYLKHPSYVLLLVAGAAAVPAWLAARRAIRPVRQVLRAMQTSVACYGDGDFSVSLVVNRRDELGELLQANNELGNALRKQRNHLVQRELLLDTVAQHSPVALVLVDPHQRVVYANIASRHLLNEGRSLLGCDFAAILQAAPVALRDAVATEGDCLFSTWIGGTEETFSLAQRAFMLHSQRHRMFLLKTLTRELSRQEVATWKKLIRVVSHELNNSLAPIASMADTGRELLRRGDTSSLVDVFAAIRERAQHLHQFVAGYAAISRLPAPRPDRVGWAELMEDLARQQPFSIAEPLPAVPGWFDRLQLEQALINVLKNAHEASGDPAQVSIRVQQTPQEQRIEVCDRGPGMTELVLAQALLPFYSTKHDGTGLGLALCREIAEAHGGSLRLSNRQGGGISVMFVLPMPVSQPVPGLAAVPGYHP